MRATNRPRAVLAALAAALTTALTTALATATGTADGVGPHDSFAPSLSANGRLVAFYTYTGDFDAEDTNDAADTYLHDRKLATTTLQSGNESGPFVGFNPSLSANGRFLAFESFTDGLVPEDENGLEDVFVRDLKTGALEIVSVASDGTAADGPSSLAFVSASGRYVTFTSEATNLAPGAGTSLMDVFVRDRKTGETLLASPPLEGQVNDGHNSKSFITPNGRFVLFTTESTQQVPGDGNESADVVVRDLKKGVTERVSVDSAGAEQEGTSIASSISGNGRHVAFDSEAELLAAGGTDGQRDAYRHDRKTHETVRLSSGITGSSGNGASFLPVLSANGRFAFFQTLANDLVPTDEDLNGKQDIVRVDCKTLASLRIRPAAEEPDDNSFQPSLSRNARLVAFSSHASNFVEDDTNGAPDIFVIDLKTGVTTRVSVDSAGGQAGP